MCFGLLRSFSAHGSALLMRSVPARREYVRVAGQGAVLRQERTDFAQRKLR
jgi:hypothetical protein